MKRLSLVAAAGACAAGALLAGCSSDGASAGNDPYESTNRSFYASHQALYRNVIRPVTVAYNEIVPLPAREGLHNFLVNVDLPVTFANDLLQGRVGGSGQTLARFTVNTTVGVGGVIDVARKIGIPEHETDFADTLAAYGVGEGSYLYVPVIGPTVPRELAGKVVDTAFDPLTYVTYGASIFVSVGRTGANYMDKRSRGVETADTIEESSPDPYVTTRILYEKHLAAEADHSATDEDFDSHPDDVGVAIAETEAPSSARVARASSSTPENAGAYCTSVASARASDAAANGIETDTQQSVYSGTYQNCLHWQTAHAQTNASGVVQISLLN